MPDARCLSRAEAAAYVGVCPDVFDLEVARGEWPPGRRRGAKGGKLTWDKRALDAAEDRRSCLNVNESPAPIVEAEMDAWDRRIAETSNKRPERRQKAAA